MQVNERQNDPDWQSGLKLPIFTGGLFILYIPFIQSCYPLLKSNQKFYWRYYDEIENWLDCNNLVGPGSFTSFARHLHDGAILGRRLWRYDGSRDDGRFWFLESIWFPWNGADVVDPSWLAGFVGAWRGCADQQPEQAWKLSGPCTGADLRQLRQTSSIGLDNLPLLWKAIVERGFPCAVVMFPGF